MNTIIGEYNNFQQYWRENTEEELHKSDCPHPHQLLHLEITKAIGNTDDYHVKIYQGRNKKTLIKESVLEQSSLGFKSSTENKEEFLSLDSEVLRLSGLGLVETCSEHPYEFLPCRYFSGWIQYPQDLDHPEDLTDVRPLTLHDQGDVAGVNINGQDFSVELTQLVYAHTIKVMKLAIYHESPESLGINSRAISYTWTNPEAKRIGINLRNILTGWTMIEPGYVSSNNLS